MSGAGELIRCSVDGCNWSLFTPLEGFGMTPHQRANALEATLETHYATHGTLEFLKTIKRLQDLAGLPNDWKPTSEAINQLPAPLRSYIHDLETNADPAGMVRENALLRDQVAVCQLMLQERGVRA